MTENHKNFKSMDYSILTKIDWEAFINMEFIGSISIFCQFSNKENCNEKIYKGYILEVTSMGVKFLLTCLLKVMNWKIKYLHVINKTFNADVRRI